MQIKKTVDWDALTPEELEALETGKKTEQDFIKELEEKEQEEMKKKEEEYNKAKQLAENYKIRAEKAESKAKEDKETAPKTENTLSQSDLIALLKADVAEDDIQEVVDYATLKKIPVKDALKSSVIRSVLAERKEEKLSAQAAATQAKNKGGVAISGEELLKNAETGKVPSSDEEIKDLVEARFQRKVKK